MRSLLFLFLLACLVPAAAAEKRAFIVGVGQYQNLTSLTKTENDARGYAGLFTADLGYQVTSLLNPTRAEFTSAFGDFLATISPGDEVAFIFSGHGWSDGAENYLVLSDAPRLASEYVLKAETVAISQNVLRQLKNRNPAVIFAVIDACRDYPFDTMTMNAFQRGLVRPDVSEGMLVIYSASGQQAALDRLSEADESQYSVFTRVMLPKLRETDRPLQDIAREVKSDVQSLAMQVNHNQRPAYYDEMLRDFCFAGTCRKAAPGPDMEATLWLEVSSAAVGGLADCTALLRYLERYPGGRFSAQANNYLQLAICEAPVRSVEVTDESPLECNALDQNFVVYFEWDRTNLTSSAFDLVQQSAARTRSLGDSCRVVSAQVTAHTDTAGPADYNLVKSERMAMAVVAALESEGIPRETISAYARGEFELAKPTEDDSREPLNRRVEVALTVGP